MDELSQNQNTYSSMQPESSQENHGVNYIIVFAIVLFLIVISYVLYTNTDILQNTETDKARYSQEEKLEILESLAAEPENIPTIEEREEILKTLSEKSADAREYSKEEKLNILYSLQQ